MSMLETEFICEVTNLKKGGIENEKVSYGWVVKQLGFDKYYKVYSPVLRGLPDFIVSEVSLVPLKAGFYEIKFENRKLSKQQVIVLGELCKIAPTYIVRVFRDGKITVEQIKKEVEDDGVD